VLVIRHPDPKPLANTFRVCGASCGVRNLRLYPVKPLDIGWFETKNWRQTMPQKIKTLCPNEADMPILRRAAAGYIIVTMVDGHPRYNYADGVPVSLRNRGDGGQAHFQRLVINGWLVPDKDALFVDMPNAQVYRALRPRQ
jgi:hypothetical protein